MRILAALSLAILGLSAWLAPRFRQKGAAGLPDETFFERDPVARIARAEREGPLGALFVGYEERCREQPDDMAALAGRIRTGLKLGAAVLNDGSVGEMVHRQVEDYLRFRSRLDPDGKLLQEILSEWLGIRLEHRYWHAQVSAAIYLAARGDPRGFRKFEEYEKRGKFYGEFFRYTRRFHPAFRAARPVIEHYLELGELNGRVQAGTALLDYHTLFGEGADLLGKYGAEIRDAIFEATSPVPSQFTDGENRDRTEAAILGLAMLHDPAATAKLRTIEDMDAPQYIGALRMARVWAGIEPFDSYRIGSETWIQLDQGAQEYYFRAAAHNYAWSRRAPPPADEAEKARRADFERSLLPILEDGLRHPSDATRVLCMQTLLANSAEHREALPARLLSGGAGFEIILAVDALPPDVDRVPILLPAIALAYPNYSAFAAANLLELPE